MSRACGQTSSGTLKTDNLDRASVEALLAMPQLELGPPINKTVTSPAAAAGPEVL